MAIKIIKPGNPNAKLEIFSEICDACECHLEFERDDAKSRDNQWWVRCPHCGTDVLAEGIKT
jgi:uncharacterized Zn finger protein